MWGVRKKAQLKPALSFILKISELKKGNSNVLAKKDQKLIELILSCKDSIHTAEELLRMDRKGLMKVRDSLLIGLRGKLHRVDSEFFIQETSILGVVNDLFLARQ